MKRALFPFLLLFVGCASQETFAVRVMRPAPVELGRYDLVAIDHFTGEGSEVLSLELADALRNAKNPLTGKGDFEVLDRRDVDRMLDDMRRSRSNQVDHQSMEILERWKKAQILIRGEVQQHGVAENVTRKEFVDQKGACHVTFCRECHGVVAVTIEAVDSAGDHMFDKVEYHETASATTNAVDQQPPPINGATLLATARRNVVARYLARIMPHEEMVGVQLYTDGDVPELQAGNGFARAGDWEEALKSYGDAAARMTTGELAPLRYKAVFNMGVALQYLNRFADSKKALKEAYAQQQDEMILAQLQSVSQREQEYQELLQQGQQRQPETAQPAR